MLEVVEARESPPKFQNGVFFSIDDASQIKVADVRWPRRRDLSVTSRDVARVTSQDGGRT